MTITELIALYSDPTEYPIERLDYELEYLMERHLNTCGATRRAELQVRIDAMSAVLDARGQQLALW